MTACVECSELTTLGAATLAPLRYRFTSNDERYVDFSSGRVLRSSPGRPAFPVRLASELFQQARRDLGRERELVVADPLAGSGYLLSVIGLLHGETIRRLIAVDIDEGVIPTASSNLAMTTVDGLDDRLSMLQRDVDRYGKASHREALASGERLRTMLAARRTHPARTVAVADATDAVSVSSALDAAAIDIVVTDVPYGRQTTWSTTDGSADPLSRLLAALDVPVVAGDAVAAIATPKDVRLPDAPMWTRLRSGTIGHRRITYLRRAR